MITLFKVYQLAQNDSEESRSIMGHFAKAQCDRSKNRFTGIPFFKESGTE